MLFDDLDVGQGDPMSGGNTTQSCVETGCTPMHELVRCLVRGGGLDCSDLG
ncbi:MAG TPA: hypothetical protein VI997_00740 [Candidatus Thermoplasmatota archaeon]|nr:hypothetical protein [Candidatus Thermoplasmatota archaeon]